VVHTCQCASALPVQGFSGVEGFSGVGSPAQYGRHSSVAHPCCTTACGGRAPRLHGCGSALGDGTARVLFDLRHMTRRVCALLGMSVAATGEPSVLRAATAEARCGRRAARSRATALCARRRSALRHRAAPPRRGLLPHAAGLRDDARPSRAWPTRLRRVAFLRTRALAADAFDELSDSMLADKTLMLALGGRDWWPRGCARRADGRARLRRPVRC